MRFVPNDSLFNDQWYLLNVGQSISTGQWGGLAGEDLNVLPVWERGITGQGIVIGIVDDGLQYDHPDLSDNYRGDLSIDIVDGDADPIPVLADRNFHGTSVAGIAAGRGGNSIGITGVAPDASVAGIRLITTRIVSDRQEAAAISYRNQEIDIYNNSWGPADTGELAAPGPQFLNALKNGAKQGRGGLGSIFVWAAGNGRRQSDNVNYDGYANSRYTIAVASVTPFGRQASYSEPGASILVSAFGDSNFTGITSVDLGGNEGYNSFGESIFGVNYADFDYTNDFGGTSASAPMVSGVVALMLEANPALSWRDVQHILVNTARHNDPLDTDWRFNGAGHLVNHNYGFGVVDAEAAVNAAQSWIPVARERSSKSGRIWVRQEIPDNDPTGLVSTVTVEDNLKVEWVEIVFDADHRSSDDLNVVLVSPDGTESVLAEQFNARGIDHGDYNNWLFTSARQWDEFAVGTWTLRVSDTSNTREGTWNAWTLRIHGTQTFADTPWADELVGTSGDDAIAGKQGNDRLIGLGGSDRLVGGRGRDYLKGNGRADSLLGGNGSDRLFGNQGRDTLDGGHGKDYLDGGIGNDTLMGGLKTDFLTGGRGRDIFVLEKGVGRDKILDFAHQRDRLGMSDTISFDDLDILERGANTLIKHGRDRLALVVDITPNQLDRRDFVTI